MKKINSKTTVLSQHIPHIQQGAFFVMLAVCVVHLVVRGVSYKSEYNTKYDPNYWKYRFEHSQWVISSDCTHGDPHINPNTCFWDDAWYEAHKKERAGKIITIGDDGLYSYAAWEYVHGKDPTTLNAEVPPLGKYLIGWTILLFGNQNIFGLISGTATLFLLFLLNKLLFNNSFFAFLPVFLFSLEPLFYTQLRAPFLDLAYLSFLLITFLFFLKKQYILAGIALGCMMGTKNSLSTFVLVNTALVIYLFVTKQHAKTRKMLSVTASSIVVFLLTYIQFFLNGHSLKEFIGVQKWIINFYAVGVKGSFGSVWELLLFGKWQTWWNSTMQKTEWEFTWPLFVIVLIVYGIFMAKKRSFDSLFLIFIWVVLYLMFLTVIPVWPRYLLLVLPFLYNLLVWILPRLRSIRSSFS